MTNEEVIQTFQKIEEDLNKAVAPNKPEEISKCTTEDSTNAWLCRVFILFRPPASIITILLARGPMCKALGRTGRRTGEHWVLQR